MPIKAVIWDFGGVLTSSPFEAFNRYEKAHGIPVDFIRGINATNPDSNAWAQFERSDISLDQFDRVFAEESRRAGHEIPGRQVIELLSGDIRPEMVAALKSCVAHFRIGCITNNVQAGEGPGMARAHDKAVAVQEVMSLFEVVIESSKVGVRKPHPDIYRMACEALGVAPTEAVYLDDLSINLKPARALGMTTIKVVDPVRALAELAEATGLTFS
jgi:putative hydrolase of the HAD superfamily